MNEIDLKIPQDLNHPIDHLHTFSTYEHLNEKPLFRNLPRLAPILTRTVLVQGKHSRPYHAMRARRLGTTGRRPVVS